MDFSNLPVLISQLRSGAEGAKLDTMGPKMKVAMTALPIVMFPFIMNFASGVTFYWACTNIISLGQARFFKIETIRALFKIPKMIQHKKAAPPPGKKKVIGTQPKTTYYIIFTFSGLQRVC